MSRPVLILFDDARARAWSPFSETRPVGELRFGTCTLRERALTAFAAEGGGHVTADALRGFDEPGAGSVIELPDTAPEGGVWIVLSRFAARFGGGIAAAESAVEAMFDGARVGVFLPGGSPVPSAEALDAAFSGEALTHAGELEEVEVDGWLLGGPWDLVTENADALRADLEGRSEPSPHLPAGIFVQGPADRLLLADDIDLGPGVILDTRGGPIALDAGVVVEGPARLVGPLHLGAGTIVFGGHLDSVSAGPVCKLRGEIADSVITGYCNKAHDGYLGHALLGRWVNLGAGTTNSDLKNNYSAVRVTTGAGTFETGRTKVGVFLGDHVKTGIGTLFNTGTAIGAGSNVFGGGLPPKWVPPLSWSWPGGLRAYRIDAFDDVARIVTARRDQSWPDSMSELFRRLHAQTHPSGDDQG